MTDFEGLRDQIVQHVREEHWQGDEDAIRDSYELGDLQCWDKKTRYAMPEIQEQVTPSSPEPEARRSRSPQRSRRSIVQEHGRSGGKEIPKSPETRRSRKSRSGGNEPEQSSAEDLPRYCGAMRLNPYQSEVLRILRRLDEQFTHYLGEQQ